MNIKTETWLNHEIRFVEIEGEWWGIAKEKFRLDLSVSKKVYEKYVQ